MEPLLFALGAGLLLFVAADTAVTALWLDGGMAAVPRAVTRMLEAASSRIRANWVRSLLASLALIGTISIWLLLMWAGWSLVFLSGTNSLAYADGTGSPTWHEHVYFAGYTIVTLGNGEFMPQGAAWQTATVLASASGILFITLAVSYLIRFLGAAVERRALAAHILSVADDPVELLLQAWRGDRFDGLDPFLAHVTPRISHLAEQHLAFPLLHHQHSQRKQNSGGRAIFVLDEALTILACGLARPVGPSRMSLHVARRAVRHLLETLAIAHIRPSGGTPPTPDLQPLREAGVPVVTDAEFEAAVRAGGPHRRLLHGMARQSGWA